MSQEAQRLEEQRIKLLDQINRDGIDSQLEKATASLPKRVVIFIMELLGLTGQLFDNWR